MAIPVQQRLASLTATSVELVATDPAQQFALILRDPQPEEWDIAVDSTVALRVVSLDGDPGTPGAFSCKVWIDQGSGEVLAFDEGTIEAPWDGVRSSYTSSTGASPYCWQQVVLDQEPTTFASEREVRVRVACIVGGSTVATFTYWFVAADVTPPALVTAEPIAPQTVRVRFDDAMATSGAGSVLATSAWNAATPGEGVGVACQNVDPNPGVPLVVTSVAAVSDAPAQLRAGALEPYALSGGEELVLWVNGISHTVTFLVGDFATPGEATAAEVGARIAVDAPGTLALIENHRLILETGQRGVSAWLKVRSGDANGALALPEGRANGGAVQFDLGFDWEQTPACPYAITVRGTVTDDAGNLIDSGGRTLTWIGFEPTTPQGRAFDYWSMMIPLKNRSEDVSGDLRRFVNCLSEVVNWQLHDIDHLPDGWDPDTATDEQIEWMLYDMGNPFGWAELQLTAAQRRKLLRVLTAIYQSKGTAAGIEAVIYFLLGEVVQVVEHLAGGWVLGIDELGSGEPATVVSGHGAPYNFSGAPLALTVAVDGTLRTVTFQTTDFADPAAATAQEVADALAARCTGAGTFVDGAGLPAVVTAANPGPYVLAPGDTLTLRVADDTADTVVTFDGGTFTAAEALAVIVAAEPRLRGAVIGDAAVIVTRDRGGTAALQVTGGTANAAFAFTTSATTGSEALRVAIYSLTPGADATIAVTGGAANGVLGFGYLDDAMGAGSGGAVLAPSDSYTRYSFDIQTSETIDVTMEALMRAIADYMKPAHTHCVRIRPRPDAPWPPIGWTLGLSGLDEINTVLEL